MRDYDNDMIRAIEREIGGTDFIAPVVAEKLYARLVETDRDLIKGWMELHAVRVLTQAIRDLDRGARTKSRTRVAVHAFEEAAGEAASGHDGSDAALSVFRDRYVISADNTRRTVGEMTGQDHTFVAERYRGQSRNALMLAAFHEAVAKKIGDKTTAEVMTEDQYEVLMDSIVSR